MTKFMTIIENNAIEFKHISPNSINYKNLLDFLLEIDCDLIEPLTKRIDISKYAEKLKTNANFFIANELNNNRIVGLIAFYANDIKKEKAFISIIGTSRDKRQQGIAGKLLDKTIFNLKDNGYKKVELETPLNGLAKILYEKKGFVTVNNSLKRNNGICKISMELDLVHSIDKFAFPATIIEHSSKISKCLDVNLIYKRDDLFSLTGGGNKARKLCYILAEAKRKGYNAIVTAGANQSNHVRVTALFAAKLGWKTIMIIHDFEPNSDFVGNQKLTKLAGAELRFVKKDTVAQSMDMAMKELQDEGFKPLYIWGGGHCLEGSYAYYEAIKELKSQIPDKKIDYMVLASGTGTTQAGIEIGCRVFFPDCKVIGISVSRDAHKGKKAILESMVELNNFLNKPISIPEDIVFDDRWIGSGYEETYPELLETIKWAAKIEGLILDPTYTGKAFHALRNYVTEGIIPKNSNVVFWHTGGLLNLMASNVI